MVGLWKRSRSPRRLPALASLHRRQSIGSGYLVDYTDEDSLGDAEIMRGRISLGLLEDD